MSLKEAERIFDKYFANKPRVKDFIDGTHAWVKKHGYVTTMAGHVRNMKDVYSQDKSKVNGALRASVNTRIQGTGAYLTNQSLIDLSRYIKEHNLKSKIILTVHDSIGVDCHPSEIKLMARVCKHIMENLAVEWLFIDWEGKRTRFPITADIEIGMTYNDVVKYDEEDYVTFKDNKMYCKYHGDLKHIKNHLESDLITEEKYERLKGIIESKKPIYQAS